MQPHSVLKLKAKSSQLKAAQGFTLIELVIYMGLMAIIVGLFAAILVTIVRIQTQETSSRQVATELNFVMNTLTRDIRDSLWIQTYGNWMSMVTPSTTPQEIIVGIERGAIAKQEVPGGPFIPLTSNKVVVDAFSLSTFQSGGDKAIQISLTLSYNTDNPTQEYTQTFQTTASPLKKVD